MPPTAALQAKGLRGLYERLRGRPCRYGFAAAPQSGAFQNCNGSFEIAHSINVDEDGYITFTDEGKRTAESVYERHTVLTDWLVGIGVDEKTAAEDACRLEHNFSADSFEKLKNHIENYHKS